MLDNNFTGCFKENDILVSLYKTDGLSKVKVIQKLGRMYRCIYLEGESEGLIGLFYESELKPFDNN